MALPLVLAVLAAGATGGRAAAAACPDGRATGARGDRLVVGYSAAPPFVVPASSEREVSGLAIAPLRALAAGEGWDLELIELSPATLRARLAACELDAGVTGAAVSASLAAQLELSQPYLSTVTTAIVHADDPTRARPTAGHAHVLLRGLLHGLGALGALTLASWLLNTFTGFPGWGLLRWRRLDPTVSGPWAGLRWLARSHTGRVLAGVWIAAGIVLGAAARTGTPPPVLGGPGDGPLRALIERASQAEGLAGERAADGAQVSCSASALRTCFRGFARGTLVAVAGPREVLCAEARALSLDDVVLRDDLAIPEHFAYLLPPGSPLRARLDLALLRLRARPLAGAPPVPCPGGRP